MQSKQLIQSRLIKRDRGGPVEVLQRAFLLKPGLIQPGLDGNLLPSLGLIAEDELKEFGVVELLATSEGQTVWQCVQHRDSFSRFSVVFSSGDISIESSLVCGLMTKVISRTQKAQLLLH